MTEHPRVVPWPGTSPATPLGLRPAGRFRLHHAVRPRPPPQRPLPGRRLRRHRPGHQHRSGAVAGAAGRARVLLRDRHPGVRRRVAGHPGRGRLRVAGRGAARQGPLQHVAGDRDRPRRHGRRPVRFHRHRRVPGGPARRGDPDRRRAVAQPQLGPASAGGARGANPPAGPPPWTGPWNAAAGTAQTDPGRAYRPRPCSRRRPRSARPGSRRRPYLRPCPARPGPARPGPTVAVRPRSAPIAGQPPAGYPTAAARCRRDPPPAYDPTLSCPTPPATPAPDRRRHRRTPGSLSDPTPAAATVRRSRRTARTAAATRRPRRRRPRRPGPSRRSRPRSARRWAWPRSR